MGNKVQVNGTMTVFNSNKYGEEIKQKILSAPNGKVRVIKKVLIDPETNEEVVITGKLYQAPSGSLTSRIAFKLDNIKSLLIDDKKNKAQQKKVDKKNKPKEDIDIEQIASDLGMEELI